MAGSTNKYLSVLTWMITCTTIYPLEWIDRPIDLQQCQGDNVDLNWHYNTSSTSHVSLKFWIFLGTGYTLVGWNEDRSYKVYPAYAGRVTPLDDHNAGIRLHNVTPADSGVYKLELGGPGVVDTANVTVYNETLLQPLLEVDGDPINPDQILRVKTGDQIVFRLSTSKTGLAARSIVFMEEDSYGNSELIFTCWNETICEYKRKLAESGNFTIHINVTYPVCTSVSHYIQLSIQENPPMSTGILICIIVGALIVVIMVIVSVVVLRRKKFNSKHHQIIKVPQDEANAIVDEHERVDLCDNGDKAVNPDPSPEIEDDDDEEFTIIENHFADEPEQFTLTASNDHPTHEKSKIDFIDRFIAIFKS